MNKVRKKGKNIEYKKSKIKKYIYKKKYVLRIISTHANEPNNINQWQYNFYEKICYLP